MSDEASGHAQRRRRRRRGSKERTQVTRPPAAEAEGNSREQGRGSRRLEALTKPRRLDFSLPATEPLSPEEAKEMSEHLAFLRQFKAHLKLSLNAAEDLLINGAKSPVDRGVSKHLLSKIDRKVVERTLSKDALKNDPTLRARFLGGIVRLNPEVSVLLWYLESLAQVGDKREAAQAFSLTVDRIDFDAVSNAQMSTVLDLIVRTFEDHDRVQALFGLLESSSFARALDRALEGLAPPLREMFAPLRAAHRVVMLREPLPSDDRERALVERGVAEWLSAPDRILRSYSLEIRARFAELLIEELDPGAGIPIPRSLLDSLPHHDPRYARLGLVRAEQLLAEKNDDGARALLSQIAEAHPKLLRAHRRLEALSWPRRGRLALRPPSESDQRADPSFELERAFWLDTSCFVWAKIADKSDAARLIADAQVHAGLLLPGIVQVLGQGVSEDGGAFLVLPPGGRPIDAGWIAKSSLADGLLLALEGTKILRAIAEAGLELPDARLGRFLLERGGAYGLRLADLGGVEKRDPAAASIAHGRLAVELARRILAAEGRGLRADVPPAIKARLRGAAPLFVLGRLLAEHAARAQDASV
jgi:hypothetical protein